MTVAKSLKAPGMSVNCKATDHLSLHHCKKRERSLKIYCLMRKSDGMQKSSRRKALKGSYEISSDYYSNITLQIKAVYSSA